LHRETRPERRSDMRTFKSSDPWSGVVIIVTLGLFGLALFLKGFTREVLLEAAVFLVSVKLILMARKNTETATRVEQHLKQIEELLACKDRGSAN
jgi:hypothetical protein